ACRGPALANVLVRAANAARAAGRHVAPDAFAREVLAGRRHLRLDLVPIAFELLGHELSQAGERALPHLGACNANDDLVIGLDQHPCAALVAYVAKHFLGHCPPQATQVKSESQPTARSNTRLQELAAGDEYPPCQSYFSHRSPPQPLLPVTEALRPPAAW